MPPTRAPGGAKSFPWFMANFRITTRAGLRAPAPLLHAATLHAPRAIPVGSARWPRAAARSALCRHLQAPRDTPANKARCVKEI